MNSILTERSLYRKISTQALQGVKNLSFYLDSLVSEKNTRKVILKQLIYFYLLASYEFVF